MSQDQAAHAGLDVVRELLEAMMRSLEERMAPPPPPPTILARLRRLVSGRALADQVGRVACAMLRAKLGRLTSDLTETVTAELEAFAADGEQAAHGPAATLSTAPPTDSGAPDLRDAALPFARTDAPVAITGATNSGAGEADAASPPDGSFPLLTEIRRANAAVLHKPQTDANGLDRTASLPDAAIAGAPISGTGGGLQCAMGEGVRTPTHLEWLRTGVSRDALAGCAVASAVALPAPASTGTTVWPEQGDPAFPHAPKNPPSRRVRWQEACGPDHPDRARQELSRAARDGLGAVAPYRPPRRVRQTAA